MIDLRRREHARSVCVTVSRDAQGRTSTRCERSEFLGGRDDLAEDRIVELFGGRRDGLDVPEPDWPASVRDVEDRLRQFVDWLGRAVCVQHRAVCSGRSVAVGGVASEQVTSAYAVTGEIAASYGRSLPVGASGRGNGLSLLEDHALAESLAGARSALAAASGPVIGGPPAVLSSQAAAVLVHEAVGHYAEAMHVGAPAVHRLHTRIASECLSVLDDPGLSPGGSTRDDEGVRKSLGPTEIMSHGVLVAQLHSRATARAAATVPTGNARAALAWDSPIPRVWTLICSTGERSEADLVQELASGVYIHRVADGYRHGTRVSARVVLGEYVRQGRRTGQFFTGSQVNGQLDMLTRLEELGAQAVRNPNAMCGKDGQLLFDVGTVAPAMRLSRLDLSA